MLDKHRALQIPTLDGEMVEVEINYSNNKEIKDCKVVKLRISDDTEIELKTSELSNLLMVIGDAKIQKDLIPMNKTNIKKYETMLEFSFKASRQYNKGETITASAPYMIEVPDIEELYSGNLVKIGKAPTKKH